MSLRSRLILLVLLALLPALGLILYTGLEQRQRAANEARSDALRIARLISDKQNNEIQTARQVLLTLTDLPYLRDANSPACHSLLSELLKPYPQYADLRVLGPEGQIICSAISDSNAFDLADRNSIQRAATTHSTAVGDYDVDVADGRAVLPLFQPIMNGDQVQNILEIDLNLYWFEPLARTAGLVQGSEISIVGQDGTILARYPGSNEWAGRPANSFSQVKSLLQGNTEATSEMAGVDGTVRLYGFALIGNGGLDDASGNAGTYVSVGIPSQVVFSQEEQILARNLAVLALVILLALLAAWFFGDVFIVREVKPLLRATRELAAGDLSARTGVTSRSSELGELAGSFDRMALTLEQKHAQLGEAEAKYRSLVEQIPAVTYIAAADKKSSALYVSPQLESLLGFEPSEWLSDPEMWVRQLHPEDRERVLAEVARCHALGIPFRSEYRVSAKDGHEVWLSDQAEPVRGKDGAVLFLQGILLDITKRKRAEQEVARFNEELEQRVAERTLEIKRKSQALEAANKELEAFSYSVSHDLRAPLASIDGFSAIVLEDYGAQLPEEARRFLGLIRDNAESMKELTSALLDFSRTSRAPLKKQTVSVSDLVQQVAEGLLAQEKGRRIEVVIGDPSMALRRALPECQADPILLKQVFTNLLSNAFKYTRTRQVARVEIGSCKFGVSDSKSRTVAEPLNLEPETAETGGGATVYFVRDNGVGFDMKQADRLFGVFQRLHDEQEYEGNGVGLAIVERIVHRHGGRIWAEAKVDKGATFYFTLGDDRQE